MHNDLSNLIVGWSATLLDILGALLVIGLTLLAQINLSYRRPRWAIAMAVLCVLVAGSRFALNYQLRQLVREQQRLIQAYPSRAAEPHNFAAGE